VEFNPFKKNDTQSPETGTEEPPKELFDLLRFIVIRLVDNPDDVQISETRGDKNTVLEVKVNEADMGKVIGKKGRIIKSIRVILRAAALNQGTSVSVELMNSPAGESE
jgi:predicted RNA-binding protein YlqC (UPF0109 family)